MGFARKKRVEKMKEGMRSKTQVGEADHEE